ncbi:hypothetical protein LOZ36_002473 [Ophidiomyces ophidiicola]|nr:hypothetical protein LOZ36_002473 [Ophidiomyces ophidiicola]
MDSTLGETFLDTFSRHLVYSFPSSYTEPPFARDGSVLKYPPLPAAGEGIAGALRAATSTIAVYPFSLILTRLKLRAHAADDKIEEGVYGVKEIARTAKEIHDNEGGVRALYVGVLEAVGKDVAEVFLFMTIYRLLKRRMEAHGLGVLSAGGRLMLGIVSEAVAKFFTAPIETVLTRRQISGGTRSVTDIVKKVLAKYGVSGLWAGYSASLLLTINPLITFLLNKTLSFKAESGPLTRLISAILSRLIATSLTYPVAVTKARMQAGYSPLVVSLGKPTTTIMDSTLLHTMSDVFQGEGAAGAYAGITANMLHEIARHGIAALTKSTIHSCTIRMYYLHLFSESLLDRVKREMESLSESAKAGNTRAMKGKGKDSKKFLKASVKNIYSNETADLVADYVEDEALDHWFWEKEKRGNGT